MKTKPSWMAWLLLPATLACHAGQTHMCPPKIALQSASIAPEYLTGGFAPLVDDSVIWLSGANMFDGPPREGAVLKANTTRREGKTEVLRWDFGNNQQHEKWLSCDYAQGLIRLTLAVGTGYRHCLARATNSGKPAKLAVEFVCE
jgi:hypothetical protein